MKLTKEEFFEKYGFSEEKFKATELSWEELLDIEADYENKLTKLESVLDEFMDSFIRGSGLQNGLHSFGGRTKDSEHLIAKIIRKRLDDPAKLGDVNFSKYKNIATNNYEYIITDLIGVRGLLLFREDWIKFHDFISQHFPECISICDKADNDKNFVLTKDDFYNAPEKCMLEYPKVYLREGDSVAIYSKKLPRERIKDEKYYRSAHYILKYENHIIEVQIRTLFDEGWGEVDHYILYPNKTNNPLLTEYSEMMTRLTGMADEMASFFLRVQNVDLKGFIQKPRIDEISKEIYPSTKSTKSDDEPESIETDCAKILQNSIEQ
ncbi:MAG: GTP pyrophosphokinase [Roseburia sp.]|nr:GTP pyrophosphokinase [Roseburia sp.]